MIRGRKRWLAATLVWRDLKGWLAAGTQAVTANVVITPVIYRLHSHRGIAHLFFGLGMSYDLQNSAFTGDSAAYAVDRRPCVTGPLYGTTIMVCRRVVETPERRRWRAAWW